jgi:hypothetical protein
MVPQDKAGLPLKPPLPNRIRLAKCPRPPVIGRAQRLSAEPSSLKSFGLGRPRRRPPSQRRLLLNAVCRPKKDSNA